MLDKIYLNFWIRNGAKVCTFCRSRQEFSNEVFPTCSRIVLQKSASIPPRTSSPRFVTKALRGIMRDNVIISVFVWSKARFGFSAFSGEAWLGFFKAKWDDRSSGHGQERNSGAQPSREHTSIAFWHAFLQALCTLGCFLHLADCALRLTHKSRNSI